MLVLASCQVRELTLELLIALETGGFQVPGRHRSLYCAAGLGLMVTVSEAALLREDRDVLESRVQPVARIPELELAHAGSVDDDSSIGKHE
jgi:hypothetical protein